MKFTIAALVLSSLFGSSLCVVNPESNFESDTYYHVTCSPSKTGPPKCSVLEGLPSKYSGVRPSSHSYGMFNDKINSEGWAHLWLHGDKSDEGWYESGFLEGALSSKRIYQHFHSWYAHQQATTPVTKETEKWLVDQYDYTKQLIAENVDTDTDKDGYFTRLKQVMMQYDGIFQGLNQFAEPEFTMSHVEFLMTNGAGDLYDIIPATTPKATRDFKLKVGGWRSKEEFINEWHEAVSCSAMIKIQDDLKDVNLGHTTWTTYTNMLRVFKHYDLHGGDYQMSFSAKPGVIYSKDDFYVLPHERQQLAVMETTNGILDEDVYDLVTYKSLLTWQRMPLVNSLVTNGDDWTEMFNRFQSGTYANQYMVVDMKKFIPGQGAQPGFLWITEVIPGYTERLDVTPIMIDLGNVWPSYNVPFFKSVYILAGFQKAYDLHGANDFSYDMCYRAQMMRRDHSKVQSFEDIQHEMRRNDWVTDPLGNGTPEQAIAPRKDLRTNGLQQAWGGIDSKVTSFSRVTMAKELRKSTGLAWAQSGPTHENGDLPPFDWGKMGNMTELHLGQPEVFNFPFVEMKFGAN